MRLKTTLETPAVGTTARAWALLLDADVTLFHDPYPLLKGPLGNFTLFSLCDASAGYASVNGGVWYAQGAALADKRTMLAAVRQDSRALPALGCQPRDASLGMPA